VSASSTDNPSALRVTARFSKDVKARRLLGGGMYMTYADLGRTVVVPASVAVGEFSGGACDTSGASSCDQAACAAEIGMPGACADCTCAVLTPSLATLIGCQDLPVTARGLDAVLLVAGSAIVSSPSYSFVAADVGRLVVLSNSLCTLPDGMACTNNGVYTILSVAGGAANVSGPAVQSESGLSFEVRDGPSPLPFATTYTVHLTTNVESADGLDHVTASTGEDERLVSVLTGPDARVGDIAFANATVSPSKLSGARDVPYNAQITVSFTTAMSPASLVDGTTVRVMALSSSGVGDVDGATETLRVEAYEYFLANDVGRNLTITRATNPALLGSYVITAVGADGRSASVANFPATEQNVQFSLARNELFSGTLSVAADARSATYTSFAGPSAGPAIGRLHPATTYELKQLGRTRTSGPAVVRDANGNAIQGTVIATFTTSAPFSARLHPLSGTLIRPLHNAFAQFSRAVDVSSVRDATLFLEQPIGTRKAALLGNTVLDPDGILATPVPTWSGGNCANCTRATLARVGDQQILDERGNPLLLDPTCDLDGSGNDRDCIRAVYGYDNTLPSSLASTLTASDALSPAAGTTVSGRQVYSVSFVNAGAQDRDALLPSTFDTRTVTAILEDGEINEQILPVKILDYRFNLVGSNTDVTARFQLDTDFSSTPACTGACNLQIVLSGASMSNLYTLAGVNESFNYVLDTTAPSLACANVLVNGVAAGDTSGSGPTAIPSTSAIVATFTENTELKRETLVDAYGRCNAASIALTPATPIRCSLVGNALTITPARALARAAVEYRVDLGAGIRDAAGNALVAQDCYFTTADAPLTAAIAPSSGVQAVDTSVTMTFNGQVDPATVTVPVSPADTAASFRLSYDPPACGFAEPQSLPGCLTFDAGFTVATYDPAEDRGLIGSLNYDVLVDNAAITDAAGSRPLSPVAPASFDAANDAPEHVCTVESAGPVVDLHFNEDLDTSTVALNATLWVYRIDTGALLAPAVDLTILSRIRVNLGALGLASGLEYGIVVSDVITDTTSVSLASPVHELFVIP
jgi:hypothetical protein